jgi:error-prone DNA polymerase
MTGDYRELHCHSAFSLGDGAATPESLAARAATLGYGHLALTDHDDLGGAVRFSRACAEVGIRPLLGSEITLEDGSHLTLIVENPDGWRNLCLLLSEARGNTPRGEPRTPLRRLAERHAGIVALTGCARGRLAGLLRRERGDEARRWAGTLREIFGDRLYLEVGDHRTHQEGAVAAELLRLSREDGIPWVVTNDVHYADRGGREVHDLLTSLRRGVTLEEAHRRGWLRPSAEWCLQPPDAMARRWAHAPEGVLRTREVAERCEGFRLLELPVPQPRFPLPAPWRSADAMLGELARSGLAERLPEAGERHRRQLEHELGVIASLGMADHFLVVWDICRFAREAGILCQGRGSAANALVCYALRVTAVDPVANALLFERFLSMERPEAPDIDVDFAANEDRERVLQYVYGRYGRGHAAMVCTHVEYRGRSALRDAMRGLGFAAERAGPLAKGVDGHGSARAAAEWLRSDDGAPLRAIGVDPAEPRARALVRLVAGLDGLPRHRGIHSGGFVISGTPLGEMVPVEPASMPGRTVIQWDKDDCADVRLPKFDLLGLGMLKLLGECIRRVRDTHGVELDLGRLPLDDPAVYAGIRAADTVGLFQIESRAQANFLPRLRPTCFYDVVISVGAIRPGPMLGGQVKEMLARRRGDAPTEYPHPELRPVLERTHGMALFQEQLMRCAIVVSGCSAGEADRLRRAMSRKRTRDEMNAATATIRAGMHARGVDEAAAERVLGWLEACASYTFPESHAVSFALLAYASAWLRHHHPAEYLCSILNAQPMGFYPVSTLIHDARAHGVEVRPVELCRSGWDCSMEDGAVRMGLRYVRGLGARAGEALRAALEGGAFASAAEVVERYPVERGLRALAAAGAFRGWLPGGPREALWWVLGELRSRRSGGPLAPAPSRPEAVLPRLSAAQRTLLSHHATGVDLEGHPMRHLRERLRALGVEEIGALGGAERRDGERVTAGGVVVVRQRPPTSKGFVFVGLEDETGRLDVIVPPKALRAGAIDRQRQRDPRRARPPRAGGRGDEPARGNVLSAATGGGERGDPLARLPVRECSVPDKGPAAVRG